MYDLLIIANQSVGERNDNVVDGLDPTVLLERSFHLHSIDSHQALQVEST